MHPFAHPPPPSTRQSVPQCVLSTLGITSCMGAQNTLVRETDKAAAGLRAANKIRVFHTVKHEHVCDETVKWDCFYGLL